MSLITLLAAPAASGEPADNGVPAATSTLPLTQLGAAPDLAFYGIQGTESLAIPVPPGLTAVALNVTTQLPVNVRSGTITVMQQNRTVARVEVPPGERSPLVIPLAGAEVVDNAISVVLRSYLVPLDGYCLDPSNPLRLSDGFVSFAGEERRPDVVADFLPPVLRGLTIYLGAQPTPTESAAAIRLATAIVARYGSQRPDIELAPLPDGQLGPDRPPAPLHLDIVIRETPEAGVSMPAVDGMPALLISGPAAELENQTRLLASDVSRLAVASKAVVGPLRSAPQLPGNETTLRKLGQPGVNATGLEPQVGIGLDQTRLGRSADHVRVHLRGSHTPLPSAIGGQLVASISGETIDRWAVEPSGTIDRWVDLPDRLIQRYTTLGVQLDITGNTGRCGEFQPLTLTVDGDSPVLSRPAQPPVPAGFQSLPQALMPRVTVGFEGGFDDTRRAIEVMVALQRMSVLPIDPAPMSVHDALDDEAPAVLINAAGWPDPPVTLPVAAGQGGEITVQGTEPGGQASTLTLDPGLQFGSLQVVYDGTRTVLVATSNNAPAQLDALLAWLDDNPQRWSALGGAALIGVPGHDPVLVAADQPEATDADGADDAGVQGGSAPSLVVIGAALLVVLAGAVVFVIYRRARNAKAAP